MNKILNKLGIGQLALVEEWLETKNLPFKRENIKRLMNIYDKTEAFEVTLEKEETNLNYNGNKHVHEFIKNGEIKITIILKK